MPIYFVTVRGFYGWPLESSCFEGSGRLAPRSLPLGPACSAWPLGCSFLRVSVLFPSLGSWLGQAVQSRAFVGNHLGSRLYPPSDLQVCAAGELEKGVLPILWITPPIYFNPNYYLGVVAEQLAPIYGNSCSQDGSNESTDPCGIRGT